MMTHGTRKAMGETSGNHHYYKHGADICLACPLGTTLSAMSFGGGMIDHVAETHHEVTCLGWPIRFALLDAHTDTTHTFDVSCVRAESTEVDFVKSAYCNSPNTVLTSPMLETTRVETRKCSFDPMTDHDADFAKKETVESRFNLSDDIRVCEERGRKFERDSLCTIDDTSVYTWMKSVVERARLVVAWWQCALLRLS